RFDLCVTNVAVSILIWENTKSRWELLAAPDWAISQIKC
ncbi:hypothetical protein G9C98_000273, partial [Cotesia typhae]